jgi:dihydroxyacetone kinase-like protein
MGREMLTALIDAAVATVNEHEEMMTRLDQAIGDGDHGTNMVRGFTEIARLRDEIAELPLSDALKKMGMTLVMKVGGASGPLYGSLLMDMGKSTPEGEPDLDAAASMFEAGINAVKKRGKSDVGCKTMLDVLVPALSALQAALAEGDRAGAGTRMIAAAAHGLHQTSKMKATRGRASFLGDRSIDHLDPGAYSSAMLISSVVSTLEQTQD